MDIVGWRGPVFLHGTTQAMMSMEEVMDAHVNHYSRGSTRNNTTVSLFFSQNTGHWRRCGVLHRCLSEATIADTKFGINFMQTWSGKKKKRKHLVE
jgi:hypothetical protein